MTEQPSRNYAEGIGQAVADRSYNRPVESLFTGTRMETWEEVAQRVAKGNALLAGDNFSAEFKPLYKAIRTGVTLMSGRHLQHGDADQPNRSIEVFTNCSTSAASFLTFYLLLNGSGVGRAYDDEMMAVDWTLMPKVIPVIDSMHPDVLSGEISAMDLRSAEHLHKDCDPILFEVPDSREGWAKAVEFLETMAFEIMDDSTVLMDFSKVRERGAPIGGMQNRPASGPGPLMQAIRNIASMRHTSMDPWRAAMYVDHFLAECVLVGGARRAARMATKDWRDESVLDFIEVKRPIEFLGKSPAEIEEIRKSGAPMSFLYSSNNSVCVDAEFWGYVKKPLPEDHKALWIHAHAHRVMDLIAECSYYDGTGEPGLINQDKLTSKGSIEPNADWAESKLYKLEPGTKDLAAELADRFNGLEYQYIVNPCGEIVLSKLGGYCVIADVVPYHAATIDEALDAFKAVTRALIRTNTMDALYDQEVKRTNRIGVSLTGIHEFAWDKFGYNWYDLVDEAKSQPFWATLSLFKRAVDKEAKRYSEELGVAEPHTNTTIKPSGSTSKLFSLSEGAHLPSMTEYLRWVQFRNDDPKIAEFIKRGYPTQKLKVYEGTTVVGFPTQPVICTLGMGDKLVTAAQATPEEQYEWLRLLEKYWIVGVGADGKPLPSETGNQVSYTLKYDPVAVSFADFKRTLISGQSTVRCCSVMPQEDSSAYEYQPEEAVDRKTYEALSRQIEQLSRDGLMAEDVGFEHLDCGSGGCPIDFKEDDQLPEAVNG